MDYPIVGNKSLDQFDVLVIGSGPAGSAMASILCANGKKVLVLEAGPNYYDGLDDPAPNQPTNHFSSDEIKMGVRSMIGPHPLLFPQTFRTSTADGDRLAITQVNVIPQTVGGGSVHADMKFPRFMPVDFELGSRLGAIPGANFADWPITYDELEPFYTHTEYAVGVQGQDGADPNQPPRSKPYPMRPGPPQYGALLVAAAAKKLGYTAFPAATGINSRPYGGRPACPSCGMCGGWGCPINAKATSAVTTLRSALLSGLCQLWPETRAVALIPNGDNSMVTGVAAILPDGSRHTFTADRYVLACNGIEDARMVLLSAPGGLGNSSGLVGRNLTLHSHLVAFSIFEQRIHCYHGSGSSYAMTDFRGVPGDPNRPLGGIVEIGSSGTPIQECTTYFGALHIPVGGRLKQMMRQGAGRDRSLTMSMFGEDAPQLGNCIDLDPAVRDINGLPVPRLTYSPHAFEQQAQATYGPKMLDILMAAGAKYAALLPVTPVPVTAHMTGTLRFGPDPKTSVCQADGRFHDVGNLYACGGSLFPTSSGFNPTLTIAALAKFIAGSMLYPRSPAQALPALPPT